MSGQRRKARESALQALYQKELSQVEPDVLQDTFAADIFKGVTASLQELDALIEKHSTHWKLTRMTAIDRNILRIAVYELGHTSETPVSVVINEAIEIAKRFGTKDSGSFINGILDHVAKEIKPAKRD